MATLSDFTESKVNFFSKSISYNFYNHLNYSTNFRNFTFKATEINLTVQKKRNKLIRLVY